MSHTEENKTVEGHVGASSAPSPDSGDQAGRAILLEHITKQYSRKVCLL